MTQAFDHSGTIRQPERRFRHSALGVARLASLACALVIAGCIRFAGQQTASDYQVEAAYLLNFAKLAEWPKLALPQGDPFVIGVVGGDSDFVEVLTRAAAGKTVGAHPVVVRHLSASGDLKDCQLLFFRASERKHTQEAITGLGENSILLVGEDRAFLAQGGLLNLLPEKGTIRFQFNPDALERANIHFNPQVLAQAQIAHLSASSSPASSRKIQLRVQPDYPSLAERMSLKGTVQVQAIVGRDGAVKKVVLIGGHPVLAEAALQAVMKWKYEPAAQETVEMVKVSFGDPPSN